MTRKEQKEERKKAILMTALQLFVERGYHETKISDIAEAVPMSVGLLFHYFGSKEDLLKELVMMGGSYGASVWQMPEAEPAEFLSGMLKALFKFSSSSPWVFNMFVLMGQARRPGMPAEIRELAESSSAFDETAKLIRKGQKAGVFKSGDAKRLSVTFWAAVQGIMEEMSVNRDYKAPDPEWIVDMLRA